MFIYYWYNRTTKEWVIRSKDRIVGVTGLYPSECQMMIPGTVDPRD